MERKIFGFSVAQIIMGLVQLLAFVWYASSVSARTEENIKVLIDQSRISGVKIEDLSNKASTNESSLKDLDRRVNVVERFNSDVSHEMKIQGSRQASSTFLRP